jgi:hypothetical protein
LQVTATALNLVISGTPAAPANAYWAGAAGSNWNTFNAGIQNAVNKGEPTDLELFCAHPGLSFQFFVSPLHIARKRVEVRVLQRRFRADEVVKRSV